MNENKLITLSQYIKEYNVIELTSKDAVFLEKNGFLDKDMTGCYYHIFINAIKIYFLNKGKIHRENNPAEIMSRIPIEKKEVVLKYKEKGLLNREKKPAYIKYSSEIFFDKTNQEFILPSNSEIKIEAWFKEGKRHNLLGPSFIDHCSKMKMWEIYGEKFSENDFNKRVLFENNKKVIKEKMVNNFSGKIYE